MGLFESRKLTFSVVLTSLVLAAGQRYAAARMATNGPHLCMACYGNTHLLGSAARISIPKLFNGQGSVQVGSRQLDQTLLAVINRDRSSAGLATLRLNDPLSNVAAAHSLDMANNGYLSHDSLQGLSPFARLRRSGIQYRSAGENIGYDNGGSQTAMLKAIEVAMLHSPEHRANLLRPSFTQVGIGIALAGNTIIVTEDFTS